MSELLMRRRSLMRSKIDLFGDIVMWMKGDESGTVTIDPVNPPRIDSWEDYLGSGLTWIKDGNNGPNYDKPKIVFNYALPRDLIITNSAGYIDFYNTAPRTLILRVETASGLDNAGLICHKNHPSLIDQYSTTSHMRFFADDNYKMSYSGFGGMGFNFAITHGAISQSTGQDAKIYFHSNPVVNATFDASVNILCNRMGRGADTENRFHGDVYDCLYFHRELSDGEIYEWFDVLET